MMEENDERLIEEFLAPARREIPDNGFTRRVARHLPAGRDRVARAWTCAGFTLALALFIALDGARLLWDALRESLDAALQHGLAADADPRSLLVAGAVLLFLCYKKIASLA